VQQRLEFTIGRQLYDSERKYNKAVLLPEGFQEALLLKGLKIVF
jgi:hypothetical protein